MPFYTSGVTNFQPSDLPIYEAAMEEYVKRHNDHGLFIRYGPMDGYEQVNPKAYSLHHHDRPYRVVDMTNFYKICDRIRKEREGKRSGPSRFDERLAKLPIVYKGKIISQKMRNFHSKKKVVDRTMRVKIAVKLMGE